MRPGSPLPGVHPALRGTATPPAPRSGRPSTDDRPPRWTDTLPPTRGGALQRLDRVQPAAYARTRNHLEGAVTGLSPYLTHGLLTMPEVLGAVLRRTPLPVQHRLVAELGWRAFFRHAWAHDGDGILESTHPGPLPDAAYARVLPDDIRQGRTGIPAIDGAVRTLYATGTLHNHARLWLASYVVHLRRVHWRAGADWLVAHLLDGDLASNHLSWQWVAGTGSAKPYLFNADNVARHAPRAWHSPGTVIDRAYESIGAIATGQEPPAPPGPGALEGLREPDRLCEPPDGTGLVVPDASTAQRLRGRSVWLVHPWAIRRPPDTLPPGAVVIGLVPRETLQRWPWPAQRWRWVDAAMAEHAPLRWFTDGQTLASVLSEAASVRGVDDPHLPASLARVARLEPSPALFPEVPTRCRSFSAWWSRVTQGRVLASELPGLAERRDDRGVDPPAAGPDDAPLPGRR